VRRRARFLALAAALLFGAPAAHAEEAAIPTQGWASGMLADHPLVGRIYDAASERFVDRADLMADLRQRRYVLLGERHDNPDHHLLQAELLEALGETAWAEAVVFEMLSDDQADALPPGEAADLDALGPALDWEARGWPDWSLYRPVFAAAITGGMALVPGGPLRDRLMAVAHGGLDGIDEALRARLALDRPLPAADRDRLLDLIERAHCGYAKRARLGPMVDAQRLKDARMADRLIEAAPPDGGAAALLIAGAGHVRRDWAVPHYLARRGVAAEAVAIVAFQEVEGGETAPAPYLPRGADGAPAVDYLWFTPRVDDVDPCAKFEAQLKRMGGGTQSGDPAD
jgi:uncharacterized iron-regulated protein